MFSNTTTLWDAVTQREGWTVFCVHAMCLKLMNAAWKVRLRHPAKIVLVRLADRANGESECWPSLDSLSQDCGMTRQGVLNQLAVLESRGLIAKESKKGGASNRYRLTLPTVNLLDSGTVNAVDSARPKAESTALTTRVNGVDSAQSTALTQTVNGVDPNHQEPSEEPPPNLVGRARGNLIAMVRSLGDRLGGLFGREPGDHLGYMEESGLVELLKRTKIREEVREIVQWFGKQPRYRPESLTALVSGWNTHLDRARNHDANRLANSPPKPKTILEKEIDRILR